MNQNFRNIALWAIILLLVLALVSVFQSPSGRTGGQEIPFSSFVESLDKGRVDKVVVSGWDVQGSFNDGSGNWSYNLGGNVWAFSESNGQLAITSAVPEPSTGMLLLASLLATSWVIARRRKIPMA